jgi:hypothetical protein
LNGFSGEGTISPIKALQQLNAMQLKAPDVWHLTMSSNYLGFISTSSCHHWQLESGIQNVQELRDDIIYESTSAVKHHATEST